MLSSNKWPVDGKTIDLRSEYLMMKTMNNNRLSVWITTSKIFSRISFVIDNLVKPTIHTLHFSLLKVFTVVNEQLMASYYLPFAHSHNTQTIMKDDVYEASMFPDCLLWYLLRIYFCFRGVEVQSFVATATFVIFIAFNEL